MQGTQGVKPSFQLTRRFFSSHWEITWLDSLEQLFSTILDIHFSNYPDIKWLFLMISAREHLDFLKTPITSGFPSTSFTSCLPPKINFSPNMLIFLNSEIWQGLSSKSTGTHTLLLIVLIIIVLIICCECWLFQNLVLLVVLPRERII